MKSIVLTQRVFYPRLLRALKACFIVATIVNFFSVFLTFLYFYSRNY